MYCLTLLWVVQLLVWLVVLVAVVLLLRLIVPWLLNFLGVGISSVVMQAINIVIAAIVLIALIWFIYDLVVCLSGGFPHALGPR